MGFNHQTLGFIDGISYEIGTYDQAYQPLTKCNDPSNTGRELDVFVGMPGMQQTSRLR